MRTKSKVAEGWWDYTTLDEEILKDGSMPLDMLEEKIDRWISM